MRAETELLAEFLSGEDWPFHSTGSPCRELVRRHVAEGHYDSESVRTFWIMIEGKRAGVIRLFDLDDGTPLFDLRIARAYRGLGVGRHAVRWLTKYLFTALPAISRIEGTTRQDNHGMRRVFRLCGYTKEAHYREAWPGCDGILYDGVGYAILRRDWATGTLTMPEWDDEHAGL
ncbi:GNAT family N-acetyltransferase [Amycolatopsis sp. cg5]|uniref:GNAT family N-acetyltransferase n=1 Tax=Amycolatopsis sp. cg5 TaxID=3238802 RepID=UPI003523D1F3